MIARSISFSASSATMAPRLLTVSWISTPGMAAAELGQQ
jgi:hypothetical protein